MKRTAALILIILMLAAIPTVRGLSEYTQPGMSVKHFSSLLITGEPIDGNVFSEYGVSIVTYWAVWSADCRNQMGLLQQIHDEHPEYGVFGLLYVDGTSTVSAAREFMSENGYTFPVFVVDRVWKKVVELSPFLPQSFIVSPNGIIVEMWTAAFTSAELPLEMLSFWNGVAPGSGDVDMNGTVTTVDALHVLRSSLQMEELSEAALLCADVTGDGNVDSGDALNILRMSLNL